MWDFQELKRNHEVTLVHFVVVEFGLAITYAEMAASSDSDEKAARNFKNAWRAYRAATRFLEGASVAPETVEIIADKLNQLSILLKTKLPSPKVRTESGAGGSLVGR